MNLSGQPNRKDALKEIQDFQPTYPDDLGRVSIEFNELYVRVAGSTLSTIKAIELGLRDIDARAREDAKETLLPELATKWNEINIAFRSRAQQLGIELSDKAKSAYPDFDLDNLQF